MSLPELIAHLREKGYLKSLAVTKAFERAPRQEFVPREFRPLACLDVPIPIGEVYMSAPHVTARMVEHLQVRCGMRVLEVGTGTGYMTALLCELAGQGNVISIERDPKLAKLARRNLKRTGYEVEVVVEDGSCGLPERAPWQRIVVAAGVPAVPRPLREQLADGGLMVIPIGGQLMQMLCKIERHGTDFSKMDIAPCRFTLLIGKHAWSEETVKR
jgi:protein-L-isoaspartate(D-aspartate) O-methyltransferase